MATARARVFKTGRYFNNVSASADTTANAITLLQAKLATMVGTVKAVSITENMDAPTDLALISNPIILGNGRNATITLKNVMGANGKQRKINLQIMDMADSLTKPTTNRGLVDVGNAFIIAIGATFTDSDGGVGYFPASGRYQANFSKRGSKQKRRNRV